MTAPSKTRRADGDKNVLKNHPAPDSSRILSALPHSVLALDGDDRITEVNAAAEAFFAASRAMLRRMSLRELAPFGSPLFEAVASARARNSPFNEYRVDFNDPRTGVDRIVDVHVVPLNDGAGGLALTLEERTIADKMDRQLTHRGAARSVSALAQMLGHEIKNPLAGIRGAAQLLESSVDDDDKNLTRLICDETDRIVKLVARMETFAEGPPIERESVNIHRVLEQVKLAAQSGFARHIRFVENYDPSLPPVYGNKDMLVQVFLNLVKNAAEAVGMDAIDGEIELATAFRAGVRLKAPGGKTMVSLPLEVCVRDNGPGVPEDLAAYLYDPFVTTKTNGTGLGLALVAKVIGDHGGIIECESQPRRTCFRVLMPIWRRGPIAGAEDER